MQGLGRRGRFLATMGSIGLSLVLAATPALARHHHHHYRHHRHVTARHHHVAHHRAGGYAPPYSAMVIDGNTGRTLYADAANELRHPASLTKVMTLYMLFEQLEKGRMRLDSEITFSRHAASMEPSKLGVPPGGKITVDTAIKAIVTRSANDVAVAIAEAIGGTEPHFAAMMTQKAHELGMTRTHYANASGLPNPGQITTAHDLVILGRDIQNRFPTYYKYFSTRSFVYDGHVIASHDHLLGKVQGVDGIKTGFINASGFNLLSSVHRGDHKLIAVILGGRSIAQRDHQMMQFIAEHFAQTVGAHGTAVAARHEEEREVRAPVRSAAAERPRPAFVAASARDTRSDDTPSATPRHAADGSTGVRPVASPVTGSATTPAPLRWVTGPAPVRKGRGESVARAEAGRDPKPQTAVAQTEARQEAAAATEEQTVAHSGIQIQVGATDDADKAKALLTRARKASHRTLSRATPFTEKVKKGGETFYRARFAGLTPNRAEAACRQLKRSGFACFTTRD